MADDNKVVSLAERAFKRSFPAIAMDLDEELAATAAFRVETDRLLNERSRLRDECAQLRQSIAALHREQASLGQQLGRTRAQLQRMDICIATASDEIHGHTRLTARSLKVIAASVAVPVLTVALSPTEIFGHLIAQLCVLAAGAALLSRAVYRASVANRGLETNAYSLHRSRLTPPSEVGD